MGCNVACPTPGRPFDEDWGLPDPTGKSDAEFLSVIFAIETRILALKDRLSGPTTIHSAANGPHA